MNEILQEINNQLQITADALRDQRVNQQIDLLEEEDFERWCAYMENFYYAYSYCEE